jgi:hypothetical protein
LPTPDIPSKVTFLFFQARNPSLLNFTAATPEDRKAFDYAAFTTMLE